MSALDAGAMDGVQMQIIGSKTSSLKHAALALSVSLFFLIKFHPLQISLLEVFSSKIICTIYFLH